MKANRLGEMLWLYRTMHKLTLRDLAKECGISHATLMRIEQGRAFDMATFLRLVTWMLGQS